MSAAVIVSTGTVPDGPGYGQTSHVFYATNTALWWAFYYASTSTTLIYAKYSSDLVTWSTPTNNTFTLTGGTRQQGVSLGVFYKNIASTDVVHLGVLNSGFDTRHVRATLSGTTITWGTEHLVDTGGGNASSAPTVTVASDGSVWAQDICYKSTPIALTPALNGIKDTTASWAGADADWSTFDLLYTGAHTLLTLALFPLSSGGEVLMVGDNGGSTTGPTNIEYSLYGGSTWSPTTATDVFATTATINTNDWGCCLLSDTDVHAVRRNDATSTFTHRRWNGTSWGAGQTIPNNTCKAGAGLAMVSDGTSVWLFIIDSDAANTVRYIQWTAGAWGTWTSFETTTHVRTYVTAVYSAAKNTIAVAWSQTNGSNFDFTIEGLSTGGAVVVLPLPPLIVRQAVQRAAVW